ncbi:hypothetical protein [Paenibacillus sp. sgz302251]|uniref:hypothetical protein n=1 Tax=Paenibacillus sp. sgz302251 TaxID=3414493 RepID=UPI003C7E5707
MAQISSFKEITRNSKVQGEIEAGFNTFTSQGKKYFQITTWGSKNREIKGAASQTLQLNEQSARELVELIQSEMKI